MSTEARHAAAETESTTTGAGLLIEALAEQGVEYVFANFGSDHPALIEALARRAEEGIPGPRIVLCPHEFNALSAAQGLAMATGRSQAVMVHTDVGTANLGGSVHNAARTRVPVLIVAGKTPNTLEGELQGTRDTYINHLQDVHDQHALVRPYVKWSYDIQTGTNVKQLMYRALQLAASAPAGPVYLTGAREVLAERVPEVQLRGEQWQPIDPTPLAPSTVAEIVQALIDATRPVIVTTQFGRNPAAVPKLVEFAERLGVPVVESNPAYLNFPATHPLHLGYNADEFIGAADVIVTLDSDAPWIHSRRRPAADAVIYHLDVDPLKEDLPLWYAPATRFLRVDTSLAIAQFNEHSRTLELDRERLAARAAQYRDLHDEQRRAWADQAASGAGSLTAAAAMSALSAFLDDDTIVLNEAITHAETVFRHVPRSLPGTSFANGGSSLGWSGGGSIGLKLAHRDRQVVTIVGDGSYLLSVPSATYWIARRYDTPFLTIILNNGGWNATKQNVLRQYPDGAARDGDRYWVNLRAPADLPAIAAAAGGAFARTVGSLAGLREAVPLALAELRRGNSAVLEVTLAPISEQPA